MLLWRALYAALSNGAELAMSELASWGGITTQGGERGRRRKQGYAWLHDGTWSAFACGANGEEQVQIDVMEVLGLFENL